ncbi:prolyl oligopeptidase family serine peptidase [Parablastomonas sp. CN1-191]|uniref:prolyl oligopeptidase family serine peptidase n=1 Tax=Parablastomonas sp. CN1-191 TaxID=3400908 RepID=UPI003BF7E502
MTADAQAAAPTSPAAATTAPAAEGSDPYQWLEEWTTPRVMEWVNAHNAVTEKRLEADPRYQQLYDQALAIAGARDRIPAPSFLNGEIYNFWQDAEHLRGIWRKTTLASYRTANPEWKTVLDIDALGKAEGKSWVYKGADCLRPAERLCLVALSDGGADAVEVREFDLQTGQFVAGGFHLPDGKHDFTWEDKDHILVATDWDKDSLTASGYPFIVKRLARGAPLASATEVFRGTKSDVGAGPRVLRDGQGHQLTLVTRNVDFFTSQQFVLTSAGARQLAIPGKVTIEDLVNGRLILNLKEAWAGFAAGSLVSVPLAQVMADPAKLTPSLVWKPTATQSLDGVSSTKNRLLLSVLDNVNGTLLSLTPTAAGWTTSAVPLPKGLALNVGSTDDHSDAAFAYAAGFTTPSTLYYLDGAGQPAALKSLPAKFDASNLAVEQKFATSSDGTRVPYFVVHRKDVQMDGSTPTLLNAYGGFEASSTPSYSGTIGKLWLERGGAFVLANIRGGGEFGPAWHDAGLGIKRQVIYDDFSAVGRDLVTSGLTSPRRLGIIGGSNGGLLMGVEMTKHPEQWNAVVIQVPLLDMLRISKIAAGASWQGEYGDVNADPAVRAFWEKWSPYHALQAGVKYPEPFIFTTTKDDRVGPQHARKFAARMEAMGLPFYFYENTEGGHGSGADIKQSAKTNALTYTYLIQKLMD